MATDNPLSEAWIQVQRAETLLFQAGAYANLQQFRSMFTDVPLQNDLIQLLIRSTYGLDQNGFRPTDYQVRYPYSSVKAIREGYEALVSAGYVTHQEEDVFAPNETGWQLVRHHLHTVRAMMSAVDLGDISAGNIQKLLEYDHRILDALAASKRPHGNPILNNRLKGFHPGYEPRHLWHHWQLVWTMIAAREDEEQYLRQDRSEDPLAWFVRRQIWFADRRPWLARALTFELLLNRAVGYSPIDNSPEALNIAVQANKDRGWLCEQGDEYRLTDDGLAEQDKVEEEINVNFLNRWPTFSGPEIEELLGIVSSLNRHLADLLNQHQTN